MTELERCETRCRNYDCVACNETLAAIILFTPMVCIPAGFGILLGPEYLNIGSGVLGIVAGLTLAMLSLAFGIIRNRSITGCKDFCHKGE